VGKGALAPCPPFKSIGRDGGHASLCPPYEVSIRVSHTFIAEMIGRIGKAKRGHPLLSERSGNILQITTPIGRKKTTFDEAMKTAMRPIRNARDFPMLLRIKVNVVDMTLKVVVANGVLPIAALPDAFLP
jgi:hypothetical protein